MIDGLAELWAETTGDPRVVVAVLDGPVDRGHPSLAGARLEVVGGSSGSEAPRRGTGPPSPASSSASIIRGAPFLGIAPGCRGLIVPIFGDERDSDPNHQSFRPSCSPIEFARAIVTAVEAGASIINISAGQFGEARSAGPILDRAVARAVRRGVLVVAAAGNDGCDCSHVPASLPGVLAVGALDVNGRPLASSNWGGAYLASGLLAPGAGLVAATAGGGESLVEGTSFAAAVASGAAALLWSLALRRGRAPEGSGIRRILLDATLPCLDDATTCRRYLAGRLDLDRAVRRVRVEGVRMSDEFPMPPLTEGPNPADVAASSGPAVVASSGCGSPLVGPRPRPGARGPWSSRWARSDMTWSPRPDATRSHST